MIQLWPAEFADRYRLAGYWTDETFPSMLASRAMSDPGKLAVVDERVRWSYAELYSRAGRIAAGLLRLGLVRGDRVVVQLPNRAELIAVMFGLFRAGMIPVMSLPSHRRAEISHFVSASGARGYVITDVHDGFDYRVLARELCQANALLEHVIVVGDAQEFTSLKDLVNDVVNDGGNDVVGDAADVPSLRSGVDPFEVALVQISGGSGGRSKLIPRTTADYLYSARASVPICGVTSESVYLTALPAAHNFPMSSPGWLGVLHAGGTVVLATLRAADDAFSWIARERVTHVGLVPPLALLWLEAVGNTTYDLSSLEVIQVGGARLPDEVARRIMPAFGCRLQQVFGMAEGLVNYTRLDDPDEVITSSQGRPISPDDELRIVDDEGRSVGPGEPGRLETRGPYTIRAYHGEPEANATSFTSDGFYRTGDVVLLRSDGNLEVRGRVSDQINRGGEKISADELESHLLAHPGVHDAAVVGLADTWLGERTCAFVIRRDDSLRAPDIKAWLRKRGVAEYKLPDRVRFVASFPATGVGKVARRALREALRSMS